MEPFREREPERIARPPEPAPLEIGRSGALDWASALGNQAVARLARQAAEPEVDEAEADAAPPEVEQLESAGIGLDEMAGLEAADEMAEGDLTE